MTLIETIKNNQIRARKNRNLIEGNLLTTLYSEASMVGKNNGNRESTDQEVISIIKKFINNANEILKVKNDPTAYLEIEILESYLPKQMTESEIRGVVVDYRLEHADAKIGDIMGYLKKNFAGLYDAKLASLIAKE